MPLGPSAAAATVGLAQHRGGGGFVPAPPVPPSATTTATGPRRRRRPRRAAAGGWPGEAPRPRPIQARRRGDGAPSAARPELKHGDQAPRARAFASARAPGPGPRLSQAPSRPSPSTSPLPDYGHGVTLGAASCEPFAPAPAGAASAPSRPGSRRLGGLRVGEIGPGGEQRRVALRPRELEQPLDQPRRSPEASIRSSTPSKASRAGSAAPHVGPQLPHLAPPMTAHQVVGDPSSQGRASLRAGSKQPRLPKATRKVSAASSSARSRRFAAAGRRRRGRSDVEDRREVPRPLGRGRDDSLSAGVLTSI